MFTTADAAPVVNTGPVSDLTGTSVALTGHVTPLGLQSTFAFEYGETTGYGSRAPANGAGVAGNGFAPRAVTQAVGQLKPGTVYHYRLVATNAAGTAYGVDNTFTTDAAGVPARRYELVSRVDKQDVPVDNRFTGTYAGDDGNGVMYATNKLALSDGPAAPQSPRVLASRSADGWANQPLDLPIDLLEPAEELFYGTVAVSRDLKRALVISQRKLTPDAVEGTYNLYLREPAAEPFSRDNLTLVASSPLLRILTGNSGNLAQVGTSDDARTLVFTEASLSGVMYEASVGAGLRVVSQLTDGSTVAAGGAQTDLVDPHQVSADGSRIFFMTSDGLFMRQNGTTTVPISVSHRPGDPTTPVPATFMGASADGRYVMFYTVGQPSLTPDAPAAGAGSAYRYDVESDTMTYVAAGLKAKSIALPTTGDVYFPSGTANTEIYRVHNGTTTLIADQGEDGFGHPRNVLYRRTSPNGRYFAFVTTAPLTGYDTDGGAVCHAIRVYQSIFSISNRCAELYLYDSHDGSLTCPSCPTDGRPPTGDVNIGQFSGSSSSLNRMFARAVLDDGTVFFDTPESLMARDSNGVRDVYSWRNGRLTLISGGTQPHAADFSEASPDGKDVFFVTSDRLVGQDRDETADLYDARLGGGIAAQSPPPGPVSCSGDQCQEPGTAATPPQPSTQRRSGVTDKPAPDPKAKLSVLRSSFSAGTLTLTIKSSSAGRIRASGAAITATSRTVAKAGTYTLKVPLSRKTRAARKARRRVKVAVKVSLTPPFAAPTTTKLTRTLGK
jgi:hypothetical protein